MTTATVKNTSQICSAYEQKQRFLHPLPAPRVRCSFWCISLPSLAKQRREIVKLRFCRGRRTTTLKH